MTQDPSRARGATLLLTLGLGLFSACQKGPEAGAETTAHQAKKREPARVMLATVEQRETVRRLETTTRVESEHEVEVFPRAPGVLVELFVEEGDAVEKDQVLARLDDREAQIAKADAETTLAEAQANLPKLALGVREAASRSNTAQGAADQATRDHDRNIAIAEGEGGKPGLISRRDLDTSLLAKGQATGELEATQLAEQRAIVEELAGHSAVDRARLALQRAELDLSYTEITAPFDGVIAERTINVGSTLTTGASAFVLSDRTNLRTIFQRPQRELSLFRRATLRAPGDDALAGAGDAGDAGGGTQLLQIDARAEALPGLVFKGWIERIAPTIDPASGNFRVTARLEIGEPPMNLLPGMLVRLGIVTERHPDALVVPKRAIRREGDRNLIFVVRGDRAYEVIVEEGFPDGDNIEVIAIAGTLEAGDQVVVVGNRDLEDGSEVQVPQSEGSEPESAPVAGEPDADGADDADDAATTGVAQEQ